MTADVSFIWAAFAVGAVVTYGCRFFGVLAAGRINRQGLLYRWMEAVAYALLAALIARMLILPLGPAEGVPLTFRMAAVAAGMAAFAITGKNVLAGTLVATSVLIAAIVIF
ncbi:MAG: AzlD domain-containing protein [Rhodospirillales bacterium]|nr:AzlD domain-containing protein [Rhodospirillales bacterium]MCW8952294.1 AzlD domain-containing protein [Rhodospirillales bacterium]MCW8969717.1 AzlD domain-containing protein [Rhodospirillales bacterium]MCW9001213.1 AzlD domain-containing protein [Rhodospirillales bacterium]MCW9040444.1 AzlD domain-containing protein [Rhodospirillales bacterium]